MISATLSPMPLAIDRRGGRENFAHAGPALRALVADHPEPPLLAIPVADRFEAILLRESKQPSRTAETLSLRPCRAIFYNDRAVRIAKMPFKADNAHGSTVIGLLERDATTS